MLKRWGYLHSLDRAATSSENGKTMQNGETSKKNFGETRAAAAGENLRLTPPPLSELRGMLFTTAIKELDKVKRRAQYSAGAEALLKQIEPFETLIEGACGVKQPVAMPQGEEVRPAASFTPATVTRATQAAEKTVANRPGTREASSRTNGLRQATGKSRIEPSRAENMPKNRGRGGRDGLEDVQTLPSKRGQYRKKS